MCGCRRHRATGHPGAGRLRRPIPRSRWSCSRSTRPATRTRLPTAAAPGGLPAQGSGERAHQLAEAIARGPRRIGDRSDRGRPARLRLVPGQGRRPSPRSPSGSGGARPGRAGQGQCSRRPGAVPTERASRSTSTRCSAKLGLGSTPTSTGGSGGADAPVRTGIVAGASTPPVGWPAFDHGLTASTLERETRRDAGTRPSAPRAEARGVDRGRPGAVPVRRAEPRRAARGWRVVGEVASGEDAVGAAASLHPDLVLMDINLRHQRHRGTAGSSRADPDVKVVLLSTYAARTCRGCSLVRAAGYIGKGRLTPRLLREAPRRLARGWSRRRAHPRLCNPRSTL